MIEDSLAGIISAKGAGMRAVGVSTTYAADQLREAGADDVVEALAAFTPEWIERDSVACGCMPRLSDMDPVATHGHEVMGITDSILT